MDLQKLVQWAGQEDSYHTVVRVRHSEQTSFVSSDPKRWELLSLSFTNKSQVKELDQGHSKKAEGEDQGRLEKVDIGISQ